MAEAPASSKRLVGENKVESTWNLQDGAEDVVCDLEGEFWEANEELYFLDQDSEYDSDPNPYEGTYSKE